ncbi:hypothetical protein STRATTON_104 [Erwinia phage vB_EamM_Stratton]|uniref:Uncharacterized protein n=2 Tax=Erskinevirus EaH2 TaxID=2169883 RepID=A0A1B2IGZ4_9CAUD|nr:hypothetical protein G173_gp010 [Erwinia phage phiEaH2]AFQ96555.1 hypothetical protein [Erwinia phage phiEaH2]ANZ50529.1 hypothetical protein STRATTON_104 [Erwinia phage vB_EamM_Stratton]
MSQSLQEASTAVLDVLIQAGTNKLSKDEADKLTAAATTALGAGAIIDVTKPANIILATLRPVLLDSIGKMAEGFENRAVVSVEGLGDEMGKETMLTLWPKLGGAQRMLIIMLALTTVVVSGFLAYDTHLHYPDDITDVLLVSLLPLFALFVFATWPIKTLAYKSLEVATRVVEAKLQKGSQQSKPTTTTPTK